MITTELVSFIRSEITKGKTKEQIKSELLISGSGWSISDVDEAFQSIDSPVISLSSTTLNNKKFPILRILVLIIIGAISGLFYNGYIFALIKIVPARVINNIATEFITQILSLSSFGFALVFTLLIFYRKQSGVNIWKSLIVVLGSGIAFSFAIQFVYFFTLGNLGEDSSNNLFVIFFGFAGILGGGLMLLFYRVVVRFSFLSFIVLTLISGIIGAFFGFINEMTFLASTWQAIMLVGIIIASHKFLILNQKPKHSSIIIKIIAILLVVLFLFGSITFISSQNKNREDKLVHVQADLKRDGYSVIRNLESLKQSFNFFNDSYFVGYGSVSNLGSCSSPAEGSIFNIGNGFQPKEIIEKNTTSYKSQVQQLFIDMKKYTTEEMSFPFNHMQETQCFSNQDHFAYLVPSFYEKDFPKFYCIDDVYPGVQARYSKLKGPSCDDLDLNYIAPTERLIPDKPYYVYHKVKGLPEYENAILKVETKDLENNTSQ